MSTPPRWTPDGRWTSKRAVPLAAAGQNRWPPAGNYMAATGQDLMAADTVALGVPIAALDGSPLRCPTLQAPCRASPIGIRALRAGPLQEGSRTMTEAGGSQAASGSWEHDPTGRYKLRWRNEAGDWTDHVYGDDGVLGVVVIVGVVVLVGVGFWWGVGMVDREGFGSLREFVGSGVVEGP